MTIRLPDELAERVENERLRREAAARAVSPTATIAPAEWTRHLIEHGLDYEEEAKSKQVASRAACAIITDLRSRAGLADVWDSLDSEVRGEILESWANLIEQVEREVARG